MKLTPRPYQRQAVDAVWNYLETGKGRAPLVVEPTGAGKSYEISMLCREAYEFDNSVRVVIVTDSMTLVKQNYAEFIGLWPDAPAGVYSAGLNRRDMGAKILFAGIQSIYNKAYKQQRCDVLIIDECHMIPTKSDAMYQRFITDLRTINPNLVIIGFTATPYRNNGRLLYGQPDSIFEDIAHETKVIELINEGYLCAPRTWRRGMGQGEIDTKGVSIRDGEFVAAQLESKALCPETIRATVDQICEAGHDKHAWKIFGVSTAHCEALHAEFQARGYAGDVVFGHTEKERGKGTVARIIGDFDSGRLRYLISNAMLIKGFNVRRIDLLALDFATQSLNKYIQAIGRGTRPLYAPGYDLDTTEGRLQAIEAGPKPYCLVLDFGQNLTRFGAFDDPFFKEKGMGGGGDAPFKTCPECECACATAKRICPQCGFEYPEPETKLSIVPDAKPILSVEPEWLPVSAVTYKRHVKQGGTDSMKVTYQVGLSFHSEWVCLDHTGFARSKAETWWRRRDAGPIPRTVTDALEIAEYVIARPTHIRVKRDGKYDRIVGYQFAAQAVAA